mmetsp:Transcript_14417/g.23835  ORF Transcript_14417/g.23835 Transcript_14417/m.23835 type:complete len:141 (+) Transcript_14417:712-1134(+)
MEMDDFCCGGSVPDDGGSGSDSVHGDPFSPDERVHVDEGNSAVPSEAVLEELYEEDNEAVSEGDAPLEEEVVREGGNDEGGSTSVLAGIDTESLRGKGGCWGTGSDGLGDEEDEEEFGASALAVVIIAVVAGVTDDELES